MTPSGQLSRTHVPEDLSQISPLEQTLCPHVQGYVRLGAPSAHACVSLVQVLAFLLQTCPLRQVVLLPHWQGTAATPPSTQAARKHVPSLPQTSPRAQLLSAQAQGLVAMRPSGQPPH